MENHVIQYILNDDFFFASFYLNLYYISRLSYFANAYLRNNTKKVQLENTIMLTHTHFSLLGQ